ncbi:MAG: lysylphosphatidylglycerol synthase transmembrane domain-containing protein [Chloroflexota bacterium]|nr:lysylphosphatidylglycerol synthase transmembrane domain-containing protein [Chloroflexota bacterium]
MRKSLFKSRRFWIGIAISIIFLALFLYQVDFAEMGRELSKANYIYLLPGILIYLLGVFFRAVRWRYLLKPLGSFPVFRLFSLILIGMLVNNIIPARLGIVARAIILGERAKISKMAIGGTMVVEQVFDGVILLFFAAIISFFAPLSGWIQQVVYITAGLFLALLATCIVFASSPRVAQKGLVLLLRVLPEKWHSKAGEWFMRLIDGLGVMRSPIKLLVVFAMSALVWLCEAGLFYMVAFSFDLQVPYYVFMLATAVANLAWVLLMTQGGLGSFDLACQKSLELFNIGSALAASYVIVVHALILIITIPLGFVCLWIENLSLDKVIGQKGEIDGGG